MAASTAPRPAGSTYFDKKGEVHELRQLLSGAASGRDDQKKRDAIKKVIAYMTLGIDVSPLFTDMIKASATTDTVQKKMVYLYLTNYAESNPELAILAVNTLQKDCRDDDPMIRGLALRSLCSLSLSNMVEYLQPALQRALEDVNGYVRKTAVIGVVKVFYLSKPAVVETDLLPTLQRLVQDSDAHVVANAIQALDEVQAEEGGLQPTREMVTNLLNRLSQFSEWGQCAVLKLLSKYQVADEGEMFDIMNILDSLLKQSSSAVVLSVTKIFSDLTANRPDLQLEVLRRLKSSLLTLMAASTPELAYTVLVHVHALCSRGALHVSVFSSDFKQFFCRYNEPSYIKSVKIDIMTTIADDGNSEAIVAELSEYVTDVDAEISRHAIRAIGQIAVRVPSTAELIFGSLTDFLGLEIDYVSTEAAVVMKDVVRKYPEQFQRASGTVERCMKIVTEPEGKCAVLWILGEYGNLIEDAPYILENMIDNFMEEVSGSVRLEMLTAAVKLFFLRPPEMQQMLGRLLAKAIGESTHPDVRDRALLYYRLLEHSPDEAKAVICTIKEVVGEFQEEGDREAKERIFDEFNTLSIVYKQPASKFILSKSAAALMGVSKMRPPQTSEDQDPFAQEQNTAPPPEPAIAPAAATPAPMSLIGGGSDDLLGDFFGGPPTSSPPFAAAPPAARPSSSQPASDLLGMGSLLGDDDLLGGPPASAAAPAPSQEFSLNSQAVLGGQDFEARWSRLPPFTVQQRQGLPAGSQATCSSVEERLRGVGVLTIASCAMPTGALKLFIYAQQASGPVPVNPSAGPAWFLSEFVMQPGGAAQVTVKVDNAQAEAAERYVALLFGALSAYVAS